MKTYFTLSNLRRAAPIAAAAGIMAVPRILQHPGGSAILLVVVVPVLTLVAGSATAWGACGGMSGVFPRGGATPAWLACAAVAGILFLPAVLWHDSVVAPVFRGGNPRAFLLAFPQTTALALALVLWNAGFETLFFQASAMSFTARLTGSVTASVMACIALRLAVMALQLKLSGLAGLTPFMAVFSTAETFVSCVFFARAGLPGAVVFNTVVAARHFLPV